MPEGFPLQEVAPGLPDRVHMEVFLLLFVEKVPAAPSFSLELVDCSARLRTLPVSDDLLCSLWR